jgi:hypothetical protein
MITGSVSGAYGKLRACACNSADRSNGDQKHFELTPRIDTQTPAFASTTTETPRAGRLASGFW